MANDLVDRGADASREEAIAERTRVGLAFDALGVHNLVDFERCDSRSDRRGRNVEHFACELPWLRSTLHRLIPTRRKSSLGRPSSCPQSRPCCGSGLSVATCSRSSPTSNSRHLSARATNSISNQSHLLQSTTDNPAHFLRLAPDVPAPDRAPTFGNREKSLTVVGVVGPFDRSRNLAFGDGNDRVDGPKGARVDRVVLGLWERVYG